MEVVPDERPTSVLVRSPVLDTIAALNEQEFIGVLVVKGNDACMGVG